MGRGGFYTYYRTLWEWCLGGRTASDVRNFSEGGTRGNFFCSRCIVYSLFTHLQNVQQSGNLVKTPEHYVLNLWTCKTMILPPWHLFEHINLLPKGRNVDRALEANAIHQSLTSFWPTCCIRMY